MQLLLYQVIFVKRFFPTVFFYLIWLIASSQGSQPEYHIKRATGAIKIDGRLDEKDWQLAERASPFWQFFPSDTSYAESPTIVKFTYDDQFIYVGFVSIDPEPGPYVTKSLRRDFRGSENDAVAVVFDPFRNETNGQLFSINPFGVQREALISGISGRQRVGSTSSGFDLSWDNKWFSAATIQDSSWTGEMAIPLKTLRFDKGSKRWNVHMYAQDSKTSEQSTWGHLPRNFSTLSMSYPGVLIFEDAPKKPPYNISVIPYISGGGNKDFTTGEDTQGTLNVGGDAKIVVTPSLNLDLTFNPDFSNVEVDDQQTNISRFELFFPERRQFFIENSDIFASFGDQRIRPFFSRRIGLAKNPTTGLLVPNKISAGMKLSGSLNRDWRIGVLNMQTAKDISILQPGYNYSTIAIQRRIFNRSNISIIGINKQATHILNQNNQFDFGIDDQNYSRVLGLDYNLLSDDGVWNGKVFYHQAFTNDSLQNDQFAHGATLSYNITNFTITWNHQLVGKNYNPEVGYVPRRNYFLLAPGFQYRFYPNKRVSNHGPGIETEYYRNADFGNTDYRISPFYEVEFASRSTIRAEIAHEYIKLQADFDPTRSGDGTPLALGSDYTYTSLKLSYRSDRRKALNYDLQGQFGQFFNGSLVSTGGEINYLYRPYGIATLFIQYNRIRLPNPYPSGDIILLGPKFDVTFTKNLFLTSYFQYNSQLDNLNMNIRFQYRFAPVSDFFIVYTDNYFPDNLQAKSRAIFAKITYWLNI
ncbi:MAG: DUF5916 domain-containing protein [Bacteroidota bacterium]